MAYKNALHMHMFDVCSNQKVIINTKIILQITKAIC